MPEQRSTDPKQVLAIPTMEEQIGETRKGENEREMEISEAGSGESSSIQIHFQVKSAFYQRTKREKEIENTKRWRRQNFNGK